MPIKNLTKQKLLNYHVSLADNLKARLFGLLGYEKLSSKQVLHIVPCSSIHTFGMKFPVDVLFLNMSDKVIHVIRNFGPNRFTLMKSDAISVLEFPTGTLNQNEIQPGDYLDIIPDSNHTINWGAIKNILHWPVNVFIAILWGYFVITLIHNWISETGFLSLGLIAINTLLFLLFLTRRDSLEISYHIFDWIIPILTVSSTMFIRPEQPLNNTLKIVSIIIQSTGVVGSIGSLMSLGRSFGIIPANRTIQYSGAYSIVRHPLYASEILFYLGFLIGNISLSNIIITIIIVSGQLYRAIAEEKLLSNDAEYQRYLKKIRFRFYPGLI
ncbi:DUF192 domain-containing protein [candidate division KSB1 bacterium]|nr:DUF192 domain-containing protein [candidate division KSB1 bacterium]